MLRITEKVEFIWYRYHGKYLALQLKRVVIAMTHEKGHPICLEVPADIGY